VVNFGCVVAEPGCCRGSSVVHGRLAHPMVSMLSLSRLTIAYHVVWRYAAAPAPARILADFLALRFVWVCALNVLRAGAHGHGWEPGIIELVCV